MLTGTDVFIRHFGDKNANGEYEISPGTLSVMTSMINVGELVSGMLAISSCCSKQQLTCSLQVGSLTAAPLNDMIGRKGVFLSGTVAIIIGVVLQLVTSSNRDLVTAGRAILGFGVGNFSATSPLYMGVS